MNTTKNMYWSDGLFLKPHHFQFIDQNINDNFTFVLDKIYPNNYGFLDYQIDLESIKKGILSLKFCELFIQNTLINYPLNSNIMSRNITDEIVDGKKKKYYLGIKKKYKDSTNIEISHLKQLKNNNTRYTSIESEFEEVSSLYNTHDKTNFSYVKYTIQFFCEEEVSSLTDYDLISLCKIRKNNDEFFIEDNFSPPLFHIPIKHVLLEKIDVSFKLILDSMKIFEREKLKSQNLIILSSINPLIIHVQSVIKKSHVIPYDIFITFQKIISILIVFTKNYNMDVFLDSKSNPLIYNHENIFESFALLHTKLQNILDEIIDKKVEIQREFVFNFQISDDKYFIDINKKFFDKKYTFYVEFINNDKDKLIEHMNYLKVSNSEFIDTAIFSSISDIGFKLQTKSNLNFPIASNSVYIKLDTNSKAWDKIRKTKKLALYIDNNLIKDAHLVVLDDSNE